MRKQKIYACYKDDEFICIGTLKEIADYLNITYDSIRCLKYRSTKYIFIDLDKGE